MSEFNVQPNARCPYCKNPFYISTKCKEIIALDCKKCGSYFSPPEAWAQIKTEKKRNI